MCAISAFVKAAERKCAATRQNRDTIHMLTNSTATTAFTCYAMIAATNTRWMSDGAQQTQDDLPEV